jgi:F0F1-type ATP synthase assembly protein I
MLATHKTQQEQFSSLVSLLMLSAWSFAMVIASFLFLYVGHLLDSMLGTSPNFMLGLFFLAIFICVMRLYQEAWKKRNDV